MNRSVREHAVRTSSGTGGGATGVGARFTAAVMIGSMLNPVNSTMISTALVPIGRAFHASTAATVWLVAGLYLASAVAQPALGRVADRLGARRVYLTGLVLVGLSGLAGLLADSLGQLIAVRVLTGIGTSAAYPAAMAMIRARAARTADGRVPGNALGALTIAALGSAAVGPALGGLLTGLAGWRAVFAVNVPLAVAGLLMALAWLPPDGPRDTGGESLRTALDPLGVLLFTATLLPSMFFLTGLGRPDWPLLALGAAAAGALAVWERRARRPFVDLRMLAANRPLVRTYARYGASYLVIYCVLYGFTQWLEEERGYSAALTGVLMLPMCAVAALSSWAGSRRGTVRGPLLAGTVAMVVAAAALAFTGPGTPVAVLVLVGVVFGLPNGLNSVGNQTALYAQAPAGETGTAAGLFRTAQYVGAIASTSLIGLVYGERATTAGLHTAAAVLCGLGVLLLLATLLDRELSGGRGASGRGGKSGQLPQARRPGESGRTGAGR
ncbi:MFS transporter [Streptomyces sp. AV19]|uniref:MFS transporter n=1 Tax=Streptomyces sp. AV19 TaxID=2793068 RepID=UPI0018FEC97C|nr:MFS transporter [Streptomyces sp. AV19]MBH1938926.1 MFS transporter [Streptomyces sp. AV19]MDG4533315.1 MFS transporter [Streptomyces sp. AV19]